MRKKKRGRYKTANQVFRLNACLKGYPLNWLAAVMAAVTGAWGGVMPKKLQL